MKKNLPVLLSAAWIVVIFLFAASWLTHATAQPKTTGQKWEVCAITKFYSTPSNGKIWGFAQIVFFDPTGPRDQWMRYEGETIPPNDRGQDAQAYDQARERAFSDAIAQLSGQGWEMVGEMNYTNQTKVSVTENFAENRYDKAIYFKRLKP